jgi:hypothetical protein
MDSIDVNLLRHILNFLNTKMIMQSRLVCRFWRESIDDKVFLKNLFIEIDTIPRRFDGISIIWLIEKTPVLDDIHSMRVLMYECVEKNRDLLIDLIDYLDDETLIMIMSDILFVIILFSRSVKDGNFRIVNFLRSNKFVTRPIYINARLNILEGMYKLPGNMLRKWIDYYELNDPEFINLNLSKVMEFVSRSNDDYYSMIVYNTADHQRMKDIMIEFIQGYIIRSEPREISKCVKKYINFFGSDGPAKEILPKCLHHLIRQNLMFIKWIFLEFGLIEMVSKTVDDSEYDIVQVAEDKIDLFRSNCRLLYNLSFSKDALRKWALLLDPDVFNGIDIM